MPGDDVPVVQPAVVTRSAAAAAGTPEAIQDYLNDQVAVFKDRIDKKTEENIAKMIKDNNVILQEEFQKMSLAMKSLKDTVDDSIQGFRAVFETKRLAMEVDMKDIKSRVKQQQHWSYFEMKHP
jgi:nucleoside-triphosphatase THEP1